jgi:hypothetical protein
MVLALAVLAAFGLALSSGCSRGPRVRAGNLKEKREKKRAIKKSQQQALEEERRRELAAEQASEPSPATADVPASEPDSPPTTPQPQPGAAEPAPEAVKPAQAAPAVPPPASAQPTPGSQERVVPPALQPDYSQDRCRVTLRNPDGTEVSKILYQPLFAYMERTFLSGGGVADHEHSMPMFRFQVGLSLHKIKFRNLDRVEFIEDPDSRTKVRIRFLFLKGRKPEEFPAEELLGAGHPRIPVLQGVGTRGFERFPLFDNGEDPSYLRLVAVDFTP